MRITIAVFFFACAVALLVFPWRNADSGTRLGWRMKAILAAICVLAGLAALFVPYAD